MDDVLESSKKGISLLDYDWQKLAEMMNLYSPKEDVWYMITLNKGQDNEYRTRFMRYAEALELIVYALEKKKLRVKT